MAEQELTVKEFAARERVTPRTVYRWITRGVVPARTTPGGGVRIPDPRPSLHPRAVLDKVRQP